MTYLGMGFGAIFGGYGGYAIANPGSFAFAGSLGSPWVTAGVSATSLGMGTDWRYNFRWSTAAGGGGEYGKINDPANIADKAIYNAQRSNYRQQKSDFFDNIAFNLGTMMAVGSEVSYSNYFGTWMGKDFKLRSQSWGGNGTTGGKHKFARSISTKFEWAGRVIGGYNAYTFFREYSAGEISETQFYIEQASNAFSTYGRVVGAAWSIGWEAGRRISQTNWYQQAKYNFYYNYWEQKYGSPSDHNREMWEYFYNNYKP